MDLAALSSHSWILGLLGLGVAFLVYRSVVRRPTGAAMTKKYIEAGAHGRKGGAPHKAAVVGDTIGDPFKDAAGPSMNILIKLMRVISLVPAPWFLAPQR